jgi:hypothetical protein
MTVVMLVVLQVTETAAAMVYRLLRICEEVTGRNQHAICQMTCHLPQPAPLGQLSSSAWTATRQASAVMRGQKLLV